MGSFLLFVWDRSFEFQISLREGQIFILYPEPGGGLLSTAPWLFVTTPMFTGKNAVKKNLSLAFNIYIEH